LFVHWVFLQMESDGEEDVGLPQAAVLRVARAAAGDKASFAKEAQTALTSCCEQFVRLVTAESLALIEREQRSLVRRIKTFFCRWREVLV
jgi:histone H3/H4